MTKSKIQIKSQVLMTKRYDLTDRTADFGKKVIIFTRSFSLDAINRPLISQIVRSSTSIGANYMEADGAESKKDFQHKISLCKKEAKETMHWLNMLSAALPGQEEKLRPLWKEAHELVLIFASIIRNSKSSALSLKSLGH